MTNEEKYRKYMRCLNRWMSNRENGKWVADYLFANQIHWIGIYGYGMLGKHLVHELQTKSFPIKWVMDRSSLGDENYHDIQKPDNLCKLGDVDMVIITSLADVENVEAFLLQSVTGNIISIEELVDSILVWRNQIRNCVNERH